MYDYLWNLQNFTFIRRYVLYDFIYMFRYKIGRSYDLVTN